MTPWNNSAKTPVRCVEVEPDFFRFDWPADEPTYGFRKDIERMQRRNSMLRRFPFPVIRLEDAS